MIQEISFREIDGRFISDPIQFTSSDLVLHVELQEEGDILLQRSITGGNWAVAAYPARNIYLWEDGVTGKIGQIIRVVMTTSPSKISVLQ